MKRNKDSFWQIWGLRLVRVQMKEETEGRSLCQADNISDLLSAFVSLTYSISAAHLYCLEVERRISSPIAQQLFRDTEFSNSRMNDLPGAESLQSKGRSGEHGDVKRTAGSNGFQSRRFPTEERIHSRGSIRGNSDIREGLREEILSEEPD